MSGPLIDNKVWKGMAARAAMKGLVALRTDPADGPVRVLVEHHGRIHDLRSLDDLEAMLVSLAA